MSLLQPIEESAIDAQGVISGCKRGSSATKLNLIGI